MIANVNFVRRQICQDAIPDRFGNTIDRCSTASGEQHPQAGLASTLSRCDADLFEQLADKYTARMLNVAKRFLSCDEDAADAVQDAFLSAYASIDRFQGGSSVYTWLYRILVNVCLMKLRSSSAAYCVSIDALAQATEQRVTFEPADSLSSLPEERLKSKEVIELVRKCIDQLPRDYRTIILLRDIEQLSTDQAARALNLSRGVVKTRLHRARRALRSLIELTGYQSDHPGETACNRQRQLASNIT